MQVCKLHPTDRSARKKLVECEKAMRQKLFEDAIASKETQPPSETVDLESIGK